MCIRDRLSSDLDDEAKVEIDASALNTLQFDSSKPVSYTHLDKVHMSNNIECEKDKKYCYWFPQTDIKEINIPDTCLLYTSRCV